MGAALPGVGSNTLDRLLSMALANPEVVVAVVVGGLALLAGLYAVRRFARPRGTRFLEALSGLDQVAVLFHPTPDHTALATGTGGVTLAAQVATEASPHDPWRLCHHA